MKPIVHTCPEGTFACDYAQGEATKVKRAYLAPMVEVLPVRVERGFAGSDMRTVYLSSNDDISSSGGIYFDNGTLPDDDGMLEGVGSSGTIFF